MTKLITFILFISCLTCFAKDQTRCGHFQGKVIKIEQSYIFGWPDYLGSSVWDADKFKKGLQMGCEDPFRSLAMIVHWPEMTPNGGLNYQPSTHNIVIALKNSPKNTVLLGIVNNIFLADGKIKDTNQFSKQVKLDSETGLWKLEVRDPVNSRILGTQYDAYWGSEKDTAKVNKLIKCEIVGSDISLNSCEFTLYLSAYKATLNIWFTRNLLPQWPELERQALAFIHSKTIH